MTLPLRIVAASEAQEPCVKVEEGEIKLEPEDDNRNLMVKLEDDLLFKTDPDEREVVVKDELKEDMLPDRSSE